MYPTSEGIPESSLLDLRWATSLSRSYVFKTARAWNKAHKANPPFRLSVIDGWQLTDNRPETSSEGRHWISEDVGELDTFRKGIGEPDGSSIIKFLMIQMGFWIEFGTTLLKNG